MKSNDNDTMPSFEDLSRFLASRIRALEEFSISTLTKSPSRTSSVQRIHAATASASACRSASSSCPVCKARHYFSACLTFVRANPKQRSELVKRHKRCFNCLSQSHSVRECNSKYSYIIDYVIRDTTRCYMVTQTLARNRQI